METVETKVGSDPEGLIACLGWGSLVWDSRNLPVKGQWQADGPILPLEFARESGDGRMTLVIVNGNDGVPVLWSALDANSLEKAVEALAHREGVPDPKTIGRWPDVSVRGYPFADRIAEWAATKGFSGVVWTALKPGMRNRRGSVPSLEEVKAHFTALDTKSKMLATEYISRAPGQITTPYREYLAKFIGDQKAESFDT